MKKIFATFICLIYLASTQICFAASNLYFVKNTNKQTLQNIVEQGFNKNTKYTLRKTNPYLGLTDDEQDYALVILQTSSNNVFYYFNSNKNTKIDKDIKKILKNSGIVFEQSQNTMYISTFENQAQKVLTNTSNNYDFQEEYQQPQTSTTIQQKMNNTVLKGYIAEVSKGAKFNAYLQTPLNTATANVGDSVTAILSEDWVYNGNVIAQQGSVLNGQLSYARHAQYGSRNGRVVIDFNQLVTPEGKTYNISTEKIDFTVSNDGKLGKSARNVAIAAAIGTLTGIIIGSICGSDNIGRATAISAGIGVGSAAVTSIAEQGVDAEIPVYTDLELVLTKSFNVALKY